MKKVQRYIPELAFQKFEEVYISDNPLFKHEKEVFYFVMDLFFRLKVYNKNALYTEDGLIRISSKYFRAYISKNYASYLRWMVKHQLIVCDRIKKTGKAYGYEIHPDVESRLIGVEIPKNALITQKIIDNYNKRQKFHKKTDEHILQMKRYFKKTVRINTKEALDWLEENLRSKVFSMNQYCVYLLSIKMIENEEFFFNVNSANGRVDTNITNLKSDIRRFLIGDYYHIDTKNSQPLIVNFILNYIIQYSNYKVLNLSSPTPPLPLYSPSLGTEYEKILSKELNNSDLDMLKNFPLNEETIKEFNDYRAATFQKDFYNHLKEQYEDLYSKTISRTDMKELILKVFFSRNFAYKKAKALFRVRYPVITDIIFKLKKECHNKLALCLQRIESEIFIKRICKKLVENNIIPITIHDSVIVLSQDKNKAIQIISETYNEILGGIPEFEIEKLTV